MREIESIEGYDWRQDVWPHFKWAIVVDALHLRQETVHAGDCLPPGYGVAWPMLGRDAYVCMPVPLNLIAGWLRWIRTGFEYRWSPRDPERIATRLRAEFERGKRAGYERGYETGLRHAAASLSRTTSGAGE